MNTATLDAPLHLPLPGIIPDDEVDTAVLWCRTCDRSDMPWSPCDCTPDEFPLGRA